MSLTDKVEKLVRDLEKDEAKKSKALRDAEALADKFKDVRPETYSVPMERFFGLPAFRK